MVPTRERPELTFTGATGAASVARSSWTPRALDVQRSAPTAVTIGGASTAIAGVVAAATARGRQLARCSDLLDVIRGAVLYFVCALVVFANHDIAGKLT